MIYTYTNARGTQFYLNKLDRDKKDGSTFSLYFFSKDERATGCDLPDGRIVVENATTGLPMLQKAQ